MSDESGIFSVSAGQHGEVALHLLEHVSQSGDQALESYCQSIGVSPAELDGTISEWCGRPAEEFLFFASALYSRQKVRGNSDLFWVQDKRKNHSHVSVFLTRMGDQEVMSELEISYSIIRTALGHAFLAETAKGIAYLSFGNAELAENDLRGMFPKAKITEKECKWAGTVAGLISNPLSVTGVIPVHTKCTPFQESVWSKLLLTLPGTFTTYGDLAASIGDKNASRAVGAALGANPVAWLIPCHRVVNADGSYGHFRWGPARKKLFLAWEAARLHS